MTKRTEEKEAAARLEEAEEAAVAAEKAKAKKEAEAAKAQAKLDAKSAKEKAVEEAKAEKAAKALGKHAKYDIVGIRDEDHKVGYIRTYGTLEEAESYVAANPDKNPTIEKHNPGLANAFGGIKGMGSL